MDIKELRKMTVPKLRDHAKQVTDLRDVLGMEKEQLIQVIAKAEGISYEAPAKDVSTISSVKQEIRVLKKQKEELLISGKDRIKTERIRRKIRRLKRLTRKLAFKAAPKQAPPPTAAPQPTPPAAG